MSVRAFRWRLLLTILGFVLCGVHLQAFAHKPSDAYLFIDVDQDEVRLRWDIALRDLDAGFDLDADGNRELTWGEVKAHFVEIDRYAFSRLRIDDGRCQPGSVEHLLDHHSDGAYLVLRTTMPCRGSGSDRITLDYRLFAEMDPTHRGVVKIAFGTAPPQLIVLNPENGPTTITSSETDNGSRSNPFAGGFVAAGVHHILIGYDHILFLICLLLPAVLTKTSLHREPVRRWSDAVKPVLVTVTAFTIAHTMTLALAGLRIVELSPRAIEPAIAATIIFTAIGNVWTTRFRDSPAMPFCFGLVHGFGFADVLHELDLPLRDFIWALLRFNLGVELGQLVIVAVTLTPLFLLRRWKNYRRGLLVPVSCLAVLVAAIWFAERVLDFKILPL